MNKLIHLPEPKLVFGYDQVMEDPRDGLTLFGPYDRRDPIYGITVGVIGTQEGIDRFLRWLTSIQGPVRNPEPKRERPPFPGFEAVFGIKCEPKPIQQVVLEEGKLQALLHYDDKHRRIYEIATLYAAPIITAAKDGLASKKRTLIQAALVLFSFCRFSNATGER